VPLVKSIQKEIMSLGEHLEDSVEIHTTRCLGSPEVKASPVRDDFTKVIRQIKELLARVDREIPLLQLAMTMSGENLSVALPGAISPSRLLQAGMFLNMGDGQFTVDPARPVQIGPTFHMSLYMLFNGHAMLAPEMDKPDILPVTPTSWNGSIEGEQLERSWTAPAGYGGKAPIWKEVIHKCRFRLCRIPEEWVFDRALGYRPSSVLTFTSPNGYDPDVSLPEDGKQKYSYHLEMVEDYDDGRVHDDQDARRAAFDDIKDAGIRESLPVREIVKIFYADTGRLLNLGTKDGENQPVLLMKRTLLERPSAPIPNGRDTALPEISKEEGEVQADVDRQLSGHHYPSPATAESVPKSWQFPQHLDQEWLAFEVYTSDNDVETDSDSDTEPVKSAPLHAKPYNRSSSLNPGLVSQLRNVSLESSPTPNQLSRPANGESATSKPMHSLVTPSPFPAVASSLSMLEMLLRLTSLQEGWQRSHLAIPDHILTYYLEETSTTGLRGDERWKARRDAMGKIGFDPYTDTLPR
jgi:hypothetical protein